MGFNCGEFKCASTVHSSQTRAFNRIGVGQEEISFKSRRVKDENLRFTIKILRYSRKFLFQFSYRYGREHAKE